LGYRRSVVLCALALTGLLADAAPARSDAAPSPVRWTDASLDAMLDDAAARAVASGATEHARLAALATIAALAERWDQAHAKRAFERIASDATRPRDEARDQAAVLARMASADEETEEGAREDQKVGVVDALAILGPFRDTGGGLEAHDGPEAAKSAFGERARYSWGSYEVAWRTVPPFFATARGVPLDLFVSPRKESCTWLASKLTLAKDQKLVVRLAATGQARLVFDGVDVGHDDAANEAAWFDRIAARVEAKAGSHLLASKVCAGAIDDEGRVRLRVTDESGQWPQGLVASADLAGVPSRSARHAQPLFERMTTALARALGAPAGAEIDARLDAAALRTLGGADDLRSPRAPGLLAALADGPIDADRLAFAAFIAPIGANRSAWLNRARAAPSADERTKSFVERRLVERHLEAGLVDWAMAAVRANDRAGQNDDEGVLLRARVDLALGTDALRLRAMRLLASTLPGRTPPGPVLEALAQVASSFDPALSLVAREALAAQNGDYGPELVVAMKARGRDAVVTSARRAFAGGVDSADEALTVVQAVAQAGAHDEARALYEQLARWAPNRAGVWSGLAQETSATRADAMRDEAIAAALRRARELDPGEARYRAELALRAHATATTEGRDDEKYLASSQAVLARRQSFRVEGKDPPEVADRELYWLRAVVMHPDRRVSELVHYARQIVIPPRTEEELYEEIPAEGDLTELIRARVHRADGGTAFPVEEANDDARPRLRWPELVAGDVVEVAFRSWTAGPVGGRADPPFIRLDYAGGLSTHPVVYNEVDVESPSDRPIYVDIVNGKADRREEKDEAGRHVMRLVWDAPVNVPDEPHAPPLSEVVPTLVLSTFKDWSAFREWYSEAIRGFTEPDAQVRALAAKLTQGKASRQAKLEAIFNFVADDIRYVNYVSGEYWLPNRPQQLLARREGDCDDKALLLITLLKATGIDAQEVMVQTRLTRQPSILRARGAAIPLFDHGIAFLPGPGGGTYLDATSPQSRLGPLPSMDARAVALRMDGPAEIVELPSSSPNDHGSDATWTIALRPDGSADLAGEERATGDDAFWMRTNLTEPGARAPWVEDHLVGTWFPTVEVDKAVDFRGDLPHGRATTRWRARSSGLARHEAQELVMPLSPSQTLASQLAPLVKRTLPVWLPPHIAPRKESRTIRVVAPKGWTFDAPPRGGDEDGGTFGRAHLEIGRDPRDKQTIVVQRTVVFDQSTIPADDYPRWRAWVQRVDALMHKTLRLMPAGGSP
jgi:hypothetical protein